MLTSTTLTAAPPVSAAVPQKSPAAGVPQPPFQPPVLYAPPADGRVMIAVGAVVSTVHAADAPALASRAAAGARPWKVWLPGAGPLSALGLAHDTTPAPSSWPSNATPASVSLNPKLATVALVGLA